MQRSDVQHVSMRRAAFVRRTETRIIEKGCARNQSERSDAARDESRTHGGTAFALARSRLQSPSTPMSFTKSGNIDVSDGTAITERAAGASTIPPPLSTRPVAAAARERRYPVPNRSGTVRILKRRRIGSSDQTRGHGPVHILAIARHRVVTRGGRVGRETAAHMSPQLRPAFSGISELAPLARQYTGVFSQRTIERTFTDTLARFSDAKVKAFIGLLALRRTRETLQSAARADVPVELTRIVFVCHDSALGQLAATLAAERLGRAIETCVVEPTSDPAAIRTASVVITVQRSSACSVIAGPRYVAWDFPEFAALDPIALRAVCDELRRHVESLLEELAAARAHSTASGAE